VPRRIGEECRATEFDRLIAADEYPRIDIRGYCVERLQLEKNFRLQNTAVRAVWVHVRRLVEEPDAFPFVEHVTQVFGGEEQLLCSSRWIGTICRDEAAYGGAQHQPGYRS
jgi:hypothetical protein